VLPAIWFTGWEGLLENPVEMEQVHGWDPPFKGAPVEPVNNGDRRHHIKGWTPVAEAWYIELIPNLLLVSTP
jgi:hypothetical protein